MNASASSFTPSFSSSVQFSQPSLTVSAAEFVPGGSQASVPAIKAVKEFVPRGIVELNPEVNQEFYEEDENYGDDQWFDLNDVYADEEDVVADGEEEDEVMSVWTPLGVFQDAASVPPSPVMSLQYDPVEELIWAGYSNGRVVSFMPDSKRYVSFSACNAELHGCIRRIIVGEEFVLTTCDDAIRLHSRGGVLQQTYSLEELQGTRAMDIAGGRHAIAAGAGKWLSIVDIAANRLVAKTENDIGTAAIKSGKYITCGDFDGAIRLRDPRTLRQEHLLRAHPGGITSFDIKENLLVSCGMSMEMFADHVVKVFDIRFTPRPLAAIEFFAGASVLKFSPVLSSTMLVASASGHYQLCDIAALAFISETSMVGSSCVTCMDLSSSGQTHVFGDADGFAHFFGDNAESCINLHSLETEIPSHRLNAEPDAGSIPNILPLPCVDGYLLSTWPTHLQSKRFGAPPPPLNDRLLPPGYTGQRAFVRAYPNPGVARGLQHLGTATLAKKRTQNDDDDDEAGGGETEVLDAEEGKLGPYGLVPAAFRPQKITLGKLGIDAFDFRAHNNTTISGLENDIINSYANSWVQIMYHINQFRIRTTNHLCNKELCLTCELSFLFHMLTQAKGGTCQATNFLRAFRHLPEAGALELLASSEAEVTRRLPQRIASFNRYVLEQMHRETTLSASPEDRTNGSIDLIFGATWRQEATCTACKLSMNKENRLFQCRLVYPEALDHTLYVPGSENNEAPQFVSTFAEILTSSMCSDSFAPRAWCDQCKAYKPLQQIRKMITIPPVFCIATSLSGPEAVGRTYYGKRGSDGRPWLQPTISVLPRLKGASETPQDASKTSQGAFLVLEPDVPVPPEAITLSLTSMLASSIVGEGDDVTTHLVALIKIDNGQEKGWYVINDFRVTQISEEDVLYPPPYLTPCLLYYTRDDIDSVLPAVKSVCPITADVFLRDASLSPVKVKNPTFIPPTHEELMNIRTMIVGLDAEFVALTMAEEQLRNDGSSITIKPARLSLGRLSVVRDRRHRNAPPLIDDYIKTPENVVDYLTRWSGLQPGDLDPAVSKHHLIPLKRAFLKTRYLVDQGLTFVGHGLKKDFRIINIYVPPEKIIDTVDIYHLPRRRKISLRFLAYHLLNKDIQIETHDSIEDARTALELYHKYLDLRERGEFEQVLENIYEIGQQSGWKLPSDEE